MTTAVRTTRSKDIETTETTKLLRHDLTDEERQAIGTDMAMAVSERTSAENDLKAIKAQMNSRIAEADAKISGSAGLLNAGYEMRKTPCVITFNYKNKIVSVTRVDTQEEVSVRPMEAHELQMKLETTKK